MRVIVINELDLTGELTKVLQGVEAGLDIAANQIKDKFLQPTDTWNHKPEFSIESAPRERTIGTNDTNYARINDGTAPHTIRAKNKKILKGHFNSPKTRPFNFQGQSSAEGEVFYAKEVKNPGISPRGWDELIEYEYSSEFSGGGKLADIIQQEINKT